MKIYSDANVTKDDLVHLATKHTTEFTKFKMTMLALTVSQVVSFGLILYLYVH